MTIVVADDHPIVLSGLQQLFDRQPGFKVVACCATGEEALDVIRRQRPDVLVLDLRMPGRSGLDVLRTMSAEKLACRTVLLTAAIRNDEVVEAVRLGAAGVVLKESPPAVLVDCLRKVHAGEQWIDGETLARAFDSMLRPGADRAAGPLTPRELEIVRMVAEGLRNKAIADRLSITEGTVKVHLHNIYDKLGVEGRLELVLCAQQRGLLG
jgi:DNA-binding NarL/FixJ family response regulator